MTSIAEALDAFRREPAPRRDPSNPFRLSSKVGQPVTLAEIATSWPSVEGLPSDALNLWTEASKARLFEDLDFAQWGLVILAPAESAIRTRHEQLARPSEYRRSDVIIGEFLGDQDLLVLAPSERGPRRVMVALPLDDRSTWFGVAPDLGSFLAKYFANAGRKFWET